MSKLTLEFEINAGQFDPQVKFASRGMNHTLFLTPNDAVLVLPGKAIPVLSTANHPCLLESVATSVRVRRAQNSRRSTEAVRFQMITNHDGKEMRVGDSVLIENGRTPGTVSELIESAAEQKQWNVDEPGVMIKSPPFGLVFLPVSALADDPITFVARNEI